MSMTPYYDHAGITIYHGDCYAFLPQLTYDVIVTDPPYGLNYESGRENALSRIANDHDLKLRDWVLDTWKGPAIVFGSWKRAAPTGAHTCLVWDKGSGVGMGDLSVPWKPNWESIYILGRGFTGSRDSSVLTGHTMVSWNAGPASRCHPNEKPVSLLIALISKCPSGVVVDPFCGSGSTLRAAKDLGRSAIGIEIEERYCEIAARRLDQEVLLFEREEATTVIVPIPAPLSEEETATYRRMVVSPWDDPWDECQ